MAETPDPNEVIEGFRLRALGLKHNLDEALEQGRLKLTDGADQPYHIKDNLHSIPHYNATRLVTATLLQLLPPKQRTQAKQFLDRPPSTVTVGDLVSFIEDLIYDEPSSIFISYVHENHEVVKKLSDTLKAYRVKVWLDRNDIKPGFRWQTAIKDAIQEGTFFIACFSKESRQRSKTYMNEELTLAIDELRQRPTDRAWFIPVLLPGGEVPDRSIGAGETLRSIQWVSLSQKRLGGRHSENHFCS